MIAHAPFLDYLAHPQRPALISGPLSHSSKWLIDCRTIFYVGHTLHFYTLFKSFSS